MSLTLGQRDFASLKDDDGDTATPRTPRGDANETNERRNGAVA